MAPAPCSRCGGPNRPGADLCQWCGQALTPPPAAVPSGYRPLTPPGPSVAEGPLDLPTSSPWLFYRVAIPLLIIGLITLGVSAVISQGVTSFNQTCSQNPVCTPEPNPSAGVAAFGVVLLVIAIILFAYGASRGGSRGSGSWGSDQL